MEHPKPYMPKTVFRRAKPIQYIAWHTSARGVNCILAAAKRRCRFVCRVLPQQLIELVAKAILNI
jgi:hypothetical protein